MAIALMAAACAGPSADPSGQAPSANPSTPTGGTPAATVASPTPQAATEAPPSADPAAQLLARLASATREWRVTIDGTESVPSGFVVVGDDGSPVPMESLAPTVLHYEGSALVVGADHLLRLHVADRPAVVIGELQRGSELRRRDISHPWQVVTTPGAGAGQQLFSLLGSLTSLEPAGETVEGGVTLLRYRAPSSVALSLVTLSLGEEARKQPDSGTLELVARADGTLVRAVVHLTSDDFDYSEALPEGMAAAPRDYDFTYTFEEARGLDLPNPTAATHRFASRFGLSLEHPAGMQVDTTDAEVDVLYRPGGERLIVILPFSKADLPTKPGSEAEALDAFVIMLAEDITQEMTITTVESTTIAARPAYVIAAETPPAAQDQLLRLEAAFVSGSRMYSIFQLTNLGSELLDRYEFEQVIASVVLDD